MQWDYCKELLELANEEINVAQPGVEKLYHESTERKRQNIISYKDLNYELSNDYNEWNAIEPVVRQ